MRARFAMVCERAPLRRPALRPLLRQAAQRSDASSGAILDSRSLQSTPESVACAGFDGHKKRKGSKVQVAVGKMGHLLALKMTAANKQDRAQVVELAVALQEVSCLLNCL